jgi:hypothetical protein
MATKRWLDGLNCGNGISYPIQSPQAVSPEELTCDWYVNSLANDFAHVNQIGRE